LESHVLEVKEPSVAAFPQDVPGRLDVLWARAVDALTPQQGAEQLGLRLGPDDFDDN
jgi:hypothetical protein